MTLCLPMNLHHTIKLTSSSKTTTLKRVWSHCIDHLGVMDTHWTECQAPASDTETIHAKRAKFCIFKPSYLPQMESDSNQTNRMLIGSKGAQKHGQMGGWTSLDGKHQKCHAPPPKKKLKHHFSKCGRQNFFLIFRYSRGS